MASQIGVTRIYTSVYEKEKPTLTQCPKCQVRVVPRGISDSRYDYPGEKHCPNCGHVFGRANH